MNKLFIKLVVLSTSLIPVLATASYPWEGKWASTKMDCKGGGEGGPFEFTKNSMQWYESTCDIRKIREENDWYLISSICRGEGETWKDTEKYKIENGRLLRKTKSDTFIYVRCK